MGFLKTKLTNFTSDRERGYHSGFPPTPYWTAGIQIPRGCLFASSLPLASFFGELFDVSSSDFKEQSRTTQRGEQCDVGLSTRLPATAFLLKDSPGGMLQFRRGNEYKDLGSVLWHSAAIRLARGSRFPRLRAACGVIPFRDNAAIPQEDRRKRDALPANSNSPNCVTHWR